MKMKKILALILCALLIVSVFAACGQKGDGKSGDVKFQLVDKEGNTVIDTKFYHEDGKAIFDEMVANFKVDYSTSTYGPMIEGIYLLNDNSVGVKAVWAETGTYLALYVDDQYSNVGIDGVEYHDGIAIKWVESAS
ncbi:MAG: hypothetical protein J5894_02960 [Clostridia bacterium]|nr:hypothetical protein [Clostridia bacterium]